MLRTSSRFSFSRFLTVSGALWTFTLGMAQVEAQPQERPPHLVAGRFGMPAVSIGQYACVVGGANSSGYRSDVECIDTQDKALKVSVVKTKLLPRMFHTAQADGPYIYVLGGMAKDEENEIIYPTTVERLNTRDNSIELMAPMPFGLRTPASAIIGKKIYVVGGSHENGEWGDDLLIYDIEKNTWEKGAPLPEAKECDLLVWHGGLLATGGFDGEKAVASVESYDLTTNKWTNLPALPTTTSAHHGAVVTDAEGKEHVVLFGDYSDMGRVQIGDPETGNWHLNKGINFSARRHMAVTTVGNTVYVIGGNVASLGSYLDDIQAFDAQSLLAQP